MSLLIQDDEIVNLRFNGSTEIFNDSWIQLIEVENKIQMNSVMFSKRLQYVMCGVLWILMLIGSKFRYIIYKYIFVQYRSKEITEINILTLVVLVVDHVSTTLLVLYVTLMVINDTSLLHITGGNFLCIPLMYIIEFGRYYSFIGGLIIAVYRIILITRHHVVSSVKRKNIILRILLFSGLSLTLFSVVINAMKLHRAKDGRIKLRKKELAT